MLQGALLRLEQLAAVGNHRVSVGLRSSLECQAACKPGQGSSGVYRCPYLPFWRAFKAGPDVLAWGYWAWTSVTPRVVCPPYSQSNSRSQTDTSAFTRPSPGTNTWPSSGGAAKVTVR